MQSSSLALARQIACPVVLISSSSNKQGSTDKQADDLCMVSSINYVNLEPLVISTTFLKTSKTGSAALASKKMAISLLHFQHLEAVEKLESLTTKEKEQISAAEYLQNCGFATARLKSNLLYIEGCPAFELCIFAQTELEQYIVVLAKPAETVGASEPNKNLEPLIRYNRLYCTIDRERLSQENERYPV